MRNWFEKEKSWGSFLERYWVAITLAIIIVAAFLIRVVGQLDVVFVDGAVLFRGTDAWYHMRVVDNVLANFPKPMLFDPYAFYPDGGTVGYHPLMSWIITSISFIVGTSKVEYVGAFLPPILGCLTLIPVYFLGKTLFNRTVGIIACVLIAVLPGEFLHRTLLGFTDQHALEVLLMVSTILFLVLAYKRNRIRYTIITGVLLGLYVLNWHGAAFLVFILGIWFWLQFLLDYLKGKPVEPLCKLVATIAGVAFVVSIGYVIHSVDALITIVSLGLLALLPITFAVLARKIHNREVFLLVMGTVVPIGIAVAFHFVPPGRILGPVFWGFGTEIQEVAPTDIGTLFASYGIAFLLMLGGFIYATKKKISLLFLLWTGILVLAYIGQRRWGYYLTINVALLAGYFTYVTSCWVKSNVRIAVIVIVVIFMLVSNIRGTIGLANLSTNINSDWYNALVWMRENTPDPFEDADAYYSRDLSLRADYGIASWWDYGHWVIYIARRVPRTSPTKQGSSLPTDILLASTGGEARELLNRGGLDLRYLILDEETLTRKYYAVASRRIDELEWLRKNAFVQRLWHTDELNGFVCIYDGGTVRIYEDAEREE